MLRELHIRNLAIIDDVTVEFEDGLNVLTGETGAGKSIIIASLCLALGERASGEFVRSGEKEAVISAFFDIPQKLLPEDNKQLLRDMGINPDEGIIMKRVISAQGKSRAYINDSMVNVQTLSEISRDIIDVHGQYEHQSLLQPQNQLNFLDAYGGLLPQRKEFTSLYESLMALNREITELTRKERERAQRIDILRFQVGEIESSNLKEGEEEALLEEYKILSNAGRLMELAHEAYQSLYSSDGACLARLSKVMGALKEISNIDSSAKEAMKPLEDAIPLLEDVSYFLRDYKDSLNFNPERLGRIQDRLELIKGLKKKYARTNIEEILAYKEKAQRELEEIGHSEERLESLKAQCEGLKIELTEKANLLSEKRKAVSKKIESEVVKELSRLSMPKSRFSINITNESGNDTLNGFKATPEGIDRVEYLISPNIGEDLRPLSKIASGGELSRVMLALRGILTQGDRVPVLVFDEIDAGIGGKAGDTVGQKLKNLSKTHQVICVTHLPQIASYGRRHLKIEKKVRGERTVVEVRGIEKEERVMEIARMLSGEATETSIKHAKEMLKNRGGL